MEKSGKSSLINAVRDLRSRDPQAARVGYDAGLDRPMKYAFSENVLLWELPAVVRVTSEYLQSVEFGQFDGVIICCNTILLDYELCLGLFCHSLRVPCVVVRGMIDSDIEAGIYDHKESYDERNELLKIKTEIEGQLRGRDLHISLYLVCAKQGNKWDMGNVRHFIRGVNKRDITGWIDYANIYIDDKVFNANQGRVEVAVARERPHAPSRPSVSPNRSRRELESPKSRPLPPSPVMPSVEREKGRRYANKTATETVSSTCGREEGKSLLDIKKKLQGEMEDIIVKAASSGELTLLDQAITKYKESFGQNDLDLENTNTAMITAQVNSLTKPKPKHTTKAVAMDILGVSSNRPSDNEIMEYKDKRRQIISTNSYSLLREAIKKCYNAAKLTSGTAL